jgi:hypothetical protein
MKDEIGLQNLVRDIVKKTTDLKNKHTEYKDAAVNYVCVFAHGEQEYEELLKVAQKMGKVIKETPTGPIFLIEPLETVSGLLKLLKIRKPDPTRPERGDADFAIPNFPEFEKKYLSKSGFKIMQKPDFYMIELVDPEFDVRAYFSNLPLDDQLGLN